MKLWKFKPVAGGAKSPATRIRAWQWALCLVFAGMGLSEAGAAGKLENVVPMATSPSVNAAALWVESAVCTVMIKAALDINKPLQSSAPLDVLMKQPATCTFGPSGNVNNVGGVLALFGAGFRMVNVSHAVTNLGVNAEGKTELLMTVVVALQKPESAPYGSGSR